MGICAAEAWPEGLKLSTERRGGKTADTCIMYYRSPEKSQWHPGMGGKISSLDPHGNS